MSTCAPLHTDPAGIAAALRQSGYAVLRAADVQTLTGCGAAQLAALAPSWDALPLDNFLRDGGRYRRRRHASFVVDEASGAARLAPHRAHWQPLEYNALHGGMHRLFEPVEPNVLAQPAWCQILGALGRVCSSVKGAQAWYVEAHQFRIDTAGGIGRPTPEGAHRDGVDFVAVFLVARHHVKGGESRVFEAAGPHGVRFTLAEPWSLLLLDDAAVIHESTPIQPDGENGHRDTLVLTYRAGGFQDEQ
jgi:hypothetical protein